MLFRSSLPAMSVLPANRATSVCVPTERVPVGRAQVPPESVQVPSWVEPSEKLIVPVAADGATVAVRVTTVPYVLLVVLVAKVVALVPFVTT